jgi:hypothetical protein
MLTINTQTDLIEAESEDGNSSCTEDNGHGPGVEHGKEVEGHEGHHHHPSH